MSGAFVAAFWLLAAICAFVTHALRDILFSSSPSSSSAGDAQTQTPEFRRFQRLYLGAYLLAMAGDWLQGPYVYALYQQYGYGQADIALLFIAGFLSSAFFGTIFGSVADMWYALFFLLLVCLTHVAGAAAAWRLHAASPTRCRVSPS